MSDKDMNFFFNFSNPYPMFNVCYIKCLGCSTPIPVFPFQAYCYYCQSCFVKIYNQPQNIKPSNTNPIPTTNIPVPVPAPISVQAPPPAPPPPPQKRILTSGENLLIPQPLLSSLLFICDFLFHFQSLLKIQSVSLSQLHSAIDCAPLSELFKTICKTLCFKLMENVYRPDSEIRVDENSMILNLGYKLSEVFDIRTEIELIWPALIGELLHLKHFKDYVKGTVLEDVKKTISTSLTIEILELLSGEEKVALIEFMLNCFMDSKEFRENVAEKVELQVALSKSKSEKKQRIKNIENEMILNPNPNPELEAEKKGLLVEEEKIKNEIEGVFFRTTHFGVDCEGNEYYFFEFEPWRIFVCRPNINYCELGTWTYYKNDEKLRKLCSELIPNKKESKLKQSIEKLISSKLAPESIQENDEPLPLQEKPNPASLETIKDIIKTIEKSFSRYLNSSKKRWNFESDEKKWRSLVSEAENFSTLSELLLDFAEKASSPLRFQKIPKQRKIKYRKVILKLWQNSQEGYLAWEVFLKACQSVEELMLGAKIYQRVIELYISKKQDDSIKHSDECYKCKDGGKLIMCENCPRVAHLKCVGLNKIPLGEWLCEHCIKNT